MNLDKPQSVPDPAEPSTKEESTLELNGNRERKLLKKVQTPYNVSLKSNGGCDGDRKTIVYTATVLRPTATRRLSLEAQSERKSPKTYNDNKEKPAIAGTDIWGEWLNLPLQNNYFS